MNRLLPAIAILVLPLAAARVDAQELWGGALVGMYPQQIQRLHTDAVRPDDATRKDTLAIPHVTIQDQPYEVSFEFENNRLKRVILRYRGSERDFDTLHSSIYKDVLSALRGKYGHEVGSESGRDVNGKIEQYTWVGDGRKIVSSLRSLAAGQATLFITYEAAAAADDLDRP